MRRNALWIGAGAVIAASFQVAVLAQDRTAFLDNQAFGVDAGVSMGDSGPAVTNLQRFLNAQRRAHSLSPISVDGHFGPSTQAALKLSQSWQRAARSGSATATRRMPPPPPPATGGAKEYTAKGTGYYPANTTMEGGPRDRIGKKLYTLQQYLAGKAPYVSCAMDSDAFPYGTRIQIPELNEKYGRDIDFRVVDTGGAFEGKGTSRIDVCTSGSKASHDPTLNGTLHLIPRSSIGLVGALDGSR